MKNLFLEFCSRNKFEKNKNQIEILDNLETFLSFKKTFFKIFLKSKPKLCFYLQGEVGVGKTMILNFFFDQLKVSKFKCHFNEFMLKVHDYRHQNKKTNSLSSFVKNLKNKYELIYLDEFQVTNIVDAMILGKLFETLFRENLKILISTNVNLDELYKDGLQREQFLPFISLIKAHSIQKQLIIKDDYRKKGTDKLKRAFYPLNENNLFRINKLFRELSRNKEKTKLTIDTKGRKFEILNHYDGLIRVNFENLCNVNLGSEDYINIALKSKIIFFENIPHFDDKNLDQQNRFITLIDILYDKKIPLVISIVSSLDQLKSSKKLLEPFKRTLSRLYELTSPKFLLN